MTESNALVMASATGLLDKSKELQKEILMEKLRSKTSQFKNLAETSKGLRMTMLDKRWAVDRQDKMILQKCLDSLQHCIKVSSLQSLIERLECLSRQLGLKFVIGQSGVNLFISSDMFYLEIIVEPTGGVKDVKIHHEGKIDQQSCEELVQCISRGDFADFTAQLEGLTAVYQLNAEKKVKCKAFSALQSLEEDLCMLRQLQGFIKDLSAQVHKSPIGFLQKRRGGHAMRLTYFVSPYELLDKEKGLQPLSAELLALGKPALGSARVPLGQSAAVLLQGSAANKLQLAPIISGQRAGKGSGPVYAPLVPQNSAMLPACFTLKLSQPTPLCAGLAKLIHATTEVEVAGDWSNAKPMLGLVAQQAYNKLVPGKTVELNLSKGLYVNLPDQVQCYFLCESRALNGCIVTSIPFTHPSHVPPLLACLRQQALFNTLVASCVRAQTKQAADAEGALMFEVSALSWQHMCVSLELPGEAALGTVEVSLGEGASPRAALHGPPAPDPHLDDYITAVLHHTLNIPLMLRALVKIWEREAASKQLNGGYGAMEPNFSCGMGGLDPPDQNPHSHPRPLYSHPHNHPTHGSYAPEQQHMSGRAAEEPRRRKRRSDEAWRRDSDDGSDSDPCQEDDTLHSTSTNEDMEGRESSVSQPEFASDLELSGLEPEAADAPASDTSNDGDGDNGLRNSFQKSDHKRQKLKTKEERARSSLLLDLAEGKPYVPSSVSIIPIGSAPARPGLELVPLASPTPPNPGTPALPSSITITPISAATARSLDDRLRADRRAGRQDERARDKKRRRRREDAMGPPDKVPPKQDPLTKPVSVSIKPSEASPPRRFSASPTPKPRHSPARSPKPPPGLPSPKAPSVSSPKHSSSSGKPSMSALKSAAAGSPKPAYDPTKKPKEQPAAPRDKDKKHPGLSFSGSGRSSPKPRAAPKPKQLEIAAVACDSPLASPLASPPGLDVRSAAPGLARSQNRKNSLSAVIDKLKSAQHCGADEPRAAPDAARAPPPRAQEYMVKPSSDGMKITINKTRGGPAPARPARPASPLRTPPGQGSPKTHTGLKPGVISGPASKKTQAMQSSKATTPGSTPPKAAPDGPKTPHKAGGPAKAARPSSGSPKSGEARAPRDKARAKPAAGAAPDAAFLVEGLIKPLDTSKFQIPKLKSGERAAPPDGRALADEFNKPPFGFGGRGEGSPARGRAAPHEAEMLLDFSAGSGSKVSGLVAVRPVFPALQLAKSPAPSPHSNSPAITDDELMDEALVGPGK